MTTDWFGSAYYELLYCDRNEEEAAGFLERLLPELSLSPGAEILDAPCGTGRHSRFLSRMGYRVTGIDLSAGAIARAKEMNLPGAEFLIHDIRQVFRVNYFDLVLNLFTSIGYSSLRDDQRIFQATRRSLKPNGLFVLDFMNCAQVLKRLNPHEEKQKDSLLFRIERTFEGNRICKQITVVDGASVKTFKESVLAYGKDDLIRMLETNGFSILKVWGDYNLRPFSETSERTILLAVKRP